MDTKKQQQLKRHDPGYRDLAERIQDYLEVERSLSEDDTKKEASRCLNCGTPFCHGYACPLSNLVPETNQLVKEGRMAEALELLLSTHQFPEFTARICPALCEGSCVIGINEEAVSIRQIEKMIIDNGFEKGWVKPKLPRRRREESVAVIGSGPAGLAAADRLNNLGYKVTVFEKSLNPGGLLLYGIPNFKLEKSVVKRRIGLMKEAGISFECGVVAGTDISYKYLQQRYSAVLLTGGTQLPRNLEIPGRDLKGIYFATDYLAEQNKVVIGEKSNLNLSLNAHGKKVVVVGGGDTGSDCIGTAIRQGAAQVYQVEIMPRAPEKRPENNPWPLWPRIDRISSSHKEGGIRYWSTRPVSFSGDKSGQVTGISCVEVDWVNQDGQYVPVNKKDPEFSIDCSLILLAMGFLGPGPDPLAELLKLKRNDKGNIMVDQCHMTSEAGVFSAGDMSQGQSLVVHAIADGKKAADDINTYISS
jgi:glutamate synthase (NADPH) small chain